MLAKIPDNLDSLSPEERDREICRWGMVAELDAISFYEQLASQASHPLLKEVLLDIAREEKTHAGEFQAVLLQIDPEQEAELAEGAEEVAEMSENN